VAAPPRSPRTRHVGQRTAKSESPHRRPCGERTELQGPDGELLGRYLRAIEVERGDYNGRVLTIRRSDATALASILECPTDQVPAKLDDLGLRHTP
jgi:hypothetical protein